MRLGLEEGRVIGCLVEKQLTTPQQYPLTLNALVLACNQSSNRDPVVCYDDRTVVQVLRRLKDDGLVRFVHPSHGRSVIRYGQSLDERLGRDERTLALVAVLLLRGPQTVGELRARSERMAAFDGIAAVEADLERMSGGPEPLVRRLPRRPGQKEERWVQLLTVDGPETVADAGGETHADRAAGAATRPGTPSRPVAAAVDPDQPGGLFDSPVGAREQLAALADEVARLRSEVAALGSAFERLQADPSR